MGPDEMRKRRKIRAGIQVSAVLKNSEQAIRRVTVFRPGGAEPDRRTDAFERITTPFYSKSYVIISHGSPTDSTDEAKNWRLRATSRGS